MIDITRVNQEREEKEDEHHQEESLFIILYYYQQEENIPKRNHYYNITIKRQTIYLCLLLHPRRIRPFVEYIYIHIFVYYYE